MMDVQWVARQSRGAGGDVQAARKEDALANLIEKSVYEIVRDSGKKIMV